MAFVHGKGTKVLVDEYDLSSYLTQVAYGATLQSVDVTTFGNDDKRLLAGRQAGQVNCSGVYDGDTSAVDETLEAALSGSLLVVSVSPQGATTVGDRAGVVSAREATYNVRGTATDAVRITATFTPNLLRHGVVLHELTAETAAANFTSVDHGTSTAYGAVANLHVTAFTGTSATIKVTDSADDTTFADLVTFGSVTGVGSEHATAPGTVNRYVRVELSGTFTTITFAVTFARNTR